MTKDYVAMSCRMAYVWGWPMVNQINRRASLEKAPEPGRLGGALPVARIGYISLLTDYIAPDQRLVRLPEPGHPVRVASWLSTSSLSLCRVPDFGTRFFTYQLVDHPRAPARVKPNGCFPTIFSIKEVGPEKRIFGSIRRSNQRLPSAHDAAR
jgi:hypothetical protein